MWMFRLHTRPEQCPKRVLLKMMPVTSARMRCRALLFPLIAVDFPVMDLREILSVYCRRVVSMAGGEAAAPVPCAYEATAKPSLLQSLPSAIEGSSNRHCHQLLASCGRPPNFCTCFIGSVLFFLQVIAEVKADPPPASMSLTEQRQLAQSIRQQMGLPPDEDDEAMKVTTCPFLSHSLSSSAGHALMCPHAPPWLTYTCPVHVMSPLRQGMLCSKGKLEI